MAALPTVDDILAKSDLPGCMGIELEPYKVGFGPLIKATINAALGPIGIIVEGLPNVPKLPTILKDLLTNLPSILIEAFNLQLGGFPSVDLGALGIPAPFNVALGGSGPTLDPLQIPKLGNFMFGLISIPFSVIKGLIEKFLTSLDVTVFVSFESLLTAALEGIGLNPEVPELPVTFVKCLTEVLTNTFKLLTP